MITLESVYHGDTFVLPIAIENEDGEPIVLTDADIKFTLHARDDVTETTDGVDISREDGNGSFTITVSNDVMEESTEGDSAYMLDVEVTWSTGVKETLFVAELPVCKDITGGYQS
jgi:hypothetical protein